MSATNLRESYGATAGTIRPQVPGQQYHGVDCTLVQQSTGVWVCRLSEVRGRGARMTSRRTVSGYGSDARTAARHALTATTTFGWSNDAHFFAATAVDRVLWLHKDGGL